MNEAITEIAPEALVVAHVIPCEQYRFRIKLPGIIDRQVRASLRRQALQEVTDTFLDCTRQYQAIAWVGAANMAFMHSPSSPRDSKSKFFHLLICAKLVELSLQHFRNLQSEGVAREYGVAIETALPVEGRIAFRNLREEFGVSLLISAPGEIKPLGQVGGEFRAKENLAGRFAPQPIKAIRGFRADVARQLAGRRHLRQCAKNVIHCAGQLFWPILIIARLLFTLWYRPAAARLLKHRDSSKNILAYFDGREGRSRNVGSYVRWKYGSALDSTVKAGSSLIVFSHLIQPENAYSVSAMRWAYQTLQDMKRQPSEGCVVVNYLISPSFLLKLYFRRKRQMKCKRGRLVRMKRETTDFVSRMIFDEFISTLEKTNAFAIEVSMGHQQFFNLIRPGVVVQADALAKTARQFTACARKVGNRVIYIADRICTRMRTSNQLIADEGSNFHFPDRTVVFDRITRDEFVRQGIPEGRIYSYCRNFSLANAASPSMVAEKHKVKQKQVVVFLQDYPDSMGALIRVGMAVAAHFSNLHVLFQQHPNFPVCEKAKNKILLDSPERLHFHKPGEALDYSRTVALITGYSTAVVPGVLQGIPLIWLRRSIDNSVYGEDYLQRIGFAADSVADVIIIMKRLFRRDVESLRECASVTTEARAIFTPPSAQEGRSLASALQQALSESFDEIAASAGEVPQPSGVVLAPVQV
jgi:hypothetical protein